VVLLLPGHGSDHLKYKKNDGDEVLKAQTILQDIIIKGCSGYFLKGV
jgi:hypothetical protein